MISLHQISDILFVLFGESGVADEDADWDEAKDESCLAKSVVETHQVVAPYEDPKQDQHEEEDQEKDEKALKFLGCDLADFAVVV